VPQPGLWWPPPLQTENDEINWGTGRACHWTLSWGPPQLIWVHPNCITVNTAHQMYVYINSFQRIFCNNSFPPIVNAFVTLILNYWNLSVIFLFIFSSSLVKFISCASLYLVRQSQQHAKEPRQVHLSGSQLSPSRVIRSVEARSAVHYQKGVPVTDTTVTTVQLSVSFKLVSEPYDSPGLHHHGRCQNKKLCLVICVVCPCICHVVQHSVPWQLVAVCNCQKSLRPECSFRVNVEAFPLTTILVYRQLSETTPTRGMTSCKPSFILYLNTKMFK
jgi:hypothetical protein